MKRILFILSFIFIVFEGNSQITIVDEDMQLTDCNSHEGYIATTINNSSTLPIFYILYRYDTLSNVWNMYSPATPNDTIYFTGCGEYKVVVTDFSSSSDTSNVYFIPCDTMRGITFLPGQDNIQCSGDSTGELRYEVIGGSPFFDGSGNKYYNYSWYKDGYLYDSGPNLIKITNLYQDTNSVPYFLYVEDSNGCIFQPIDSLTRNIDTSWMFQPDPIYLGPVYPDSVFGPIIDSVGCRGENTASVKVNVKGGKRFRGGNYYDLYLKDSNSDTIRWIDRNGMSLNVDSDTTPYYVVFDSLFAGDYTLHVTDKFGCIRSFDTITISEPDSLKDLQVSVDYNSFFCKHHKTRIKIDGVSGGHQNNLSFYWQEMLPIESDSMYVSSGTYKAYIIDDFYGCKDSLDYTLTVEHPIISYVTPTDVKCFGDSSGILQIDSIVGGVPLSNSLGHGYYEYQWSIDTTQWLIFDTTNSSIDSLFAGTYQLIIKDSLCVDTTEFIVLENTNLNLDSTITIPSCFGGSDGSIDINLTGGTAPYTVLWTDTNGFSSNNDTNISNLIAGAYVLETTDDLSCVFLDSIVVSENPELVVSFIGDTSIFCNGGQTLINVTNPGGIPPYSYSWIDENKDTISTFFQVVATAGQYTLHITDNNGCQDSDSILITEPALLEIIDTNFTEASCNVGATASVVVFGGTPPISYNWYSSSSNVPIGTDSMVSDLLEGSYVLFVSDTCGGTDSIYFEVEAYILETTIDYDTTNNSAEVNVLSGTRPCSYQWYDENMLLIDGETDSIIEDLCTDYKRIADYYCITTDDNECKDTASVLAELYFLNGSIINESTTTVYDYPWGTEIIKWEWKLGSDSARCLVCPEDGQVWVEVTDVNGCIQVEYMTVTDISLTLSPDFDTVKCDITNLDVELQVTANGGTGGYTYLWSNGQTEDKISVSINPGVYSVTVTDENLCNEDAVFNIAVMSSDCIPNVFSPNDDGSNDVWNLEDAFFYEDSKVKVFNRYGKLVFKSEDNTPWDGKNRSGNDVEDGAYFYVIDLGNDLKKIKGTVTIIR